MHTELCEKFVYKLSETIEHVKNEPTFKKCYKIRGRITREFLRFLRFLMFLKSRKKEPLVIA